eukprot:1048_1
MTISIIRFFLTYFSTALFMIYCPFFIRLSINSCKPYCNDTHNIDPSLYTSLSSTADSSPTPNAKAYASLSASHNKTDDCSASETENCLTQCAEYAHDDTDTLSSDEDEDDTGSSCTFTYDSLCIPSLTKMNKLSFAETLKLSFIFCPIWFVMNYTFNLSLNMTSVASNTIISTMSGPFSLILSKCLLHTKLSFCNLSGVLVTMLGAVFIAYLDAYGTQNDDDVAHPMWGDALALISAFIYGIYVTLIKYKIKDESSVNMFLFFGLLGLINVITLWPLLIFLDVIKYEMFVWPSNTILLLLTINGLISVASDYFWAQSILYTSPVVATVGISLMMPVAMIADEIFRNERHSFLYWSGAIFVMVGFILVNLDFKHQHDEESHHENINESQSP